MLNAKRNIFQLVYGAVRCGAVFYISFNLVLIWFHDERWRGGVFFSIEFWLESNATHTKQFALLMIDSVPRILQPHILKIKWKHFDIQMKKNAVFSPSSSLCLFILFVNSSKWMWPIKGGALLVAVMLVQIILFVFNQIIFAWSETRSRVTVRC